MLAEQEKRLLSQLLKDMEQDPVPPSSARQVLVNVAFWLLVVILLFLAFGGGIGWSYALLTVVGFAVGFLARSENSRLLYHERWPLFRRYFDRPKIEKRLSELGA